MHGLLYHERKGVTYAGVVLRVYYVAGGLLARRGSRGGLFVLRVDGSRGKPGRSKQALSSQPTDSDLNSKVFEVFEWRKSRVQLWNTLRVGGSLLVGGAARPVCT